MDTFCPNFKYFIMGNPQTGKSNILSQFMYKEFNTKYTSTIGVGIGNLYIKPNGTLVLIHVVDAASDEKFKEIIKMYFKGTHVFLFVYDITNKQSFEDVGKHIESLSSYDSKDYIKVLVGNKKDLENERQVEYEEGKAFGKDNGMRFFEISAKSGESVDKLFYAVAEMLIEKEEKQNQNKGGSSE